MSCSPAVLIRGWHVSQIKVVHYVPSQLQGHLCDYESVRHTWTTMFVKVMNSGIAMLQAVTAIQYVRGYLKE
jgi:hypothetical protein